MLVCPCCGQKFDKGYEREDGAILYPVHEESLASIVECPMSWATASGPENEVIDSLLIVAQVQAETDLGVVMEKLVKRAKRWNC